MKKFFLLAMILMVFTGCRISKNFHVVEKGKLYRSAQLTKDEFAMAFHMANIKTVVNLRGEKPNDDWYKDELAVTQEFGVKLVNIGMSAKRLAHKPDMIKLLDTLENAEYPMLIHCKAGADRTGEAAALYQMLYMGKSKKQALKSLSIKYLHIPAAMPSKHYFIKMFQGVDWVKNVYDPCSGIYKYYNPNNPVCNGADPEDAKDYLAEDDDT